MAGSWLPPGVSSGWGTRGRALLHRATCPPAVAGYTGQVLTRGGRLGARPASAWTPDSHSVPGAQRTLLAGSVRLESRGPRVHHRTPPWPSESSTVLLVNRIAVAAKGERNVNMIFACEIGRFPMPRRGTYNGERSCFFWAVEWQQLPTVGVETGV